MPDVWDEREALPGDGEADEDEDDDRSDSEGEGARTGLRPHRRYARRRKHVKLTKVGEASPGERMA